VALMSFAVNGETGRNRAMWGLPSCNRTRDAPKSATKCGNGPTELVSGTMGILFSQLYDRCCTARKGVQGKKKSESSWFTFAERAISFEPAVSFLDTDLETCK